MDLQSSERFAAQFITFVAVIPGLLGYIVYALIVGFKVKREPWKRIVTILLFSLFGFAMYIFVLIPHFNFPIPLYLVYATNAIRTYDLPLIIQSAHALIWIVSLSILVAVVSAMVVVIIQKFAPSTTTNPQDEYIKGFT